MAIEIAVKSRDRIKADYLRSYKIRNPGADVGPGGQPDIDASTFADQMVPVYASAQNVSRAILVRDATGDDLEERAREEGLDPPRLPAKGSSGFVIVQAAAAGGVIVEGVALVEPIARTRYECALTKSYADGELCPVRAVSTGPSTDQPAGTILQWEAPPPGIGPHAVVYEQTDGSGLSGGALIESDDALRERIYEARRNPPAGGNAAEYIRRVRETPGIAVEQVFVYPAIFGPGAIAIAFTVRADSPGASRIPNAAQIAEVAGYVVGRMPADDSSFWCSLLAQPIDLALEVEWSDDAAGWADVAPWPPRYDVAGTPGKIVVGSVTDATHFLLQAANGDYTGVVQPSAGNTIALYDADNRRFSRKRILSVVGAGPWTVVCDAAENASDTSYVPIGSQPVCPWSDSLDELVEPVLAYLRGFGPGEQVSPPFDAGMRQQRWPKASPKAWPNEVTNRALDGVFDLASISDATLAEGLGTTTSVGAPGVFSYLITPRYLTVFPE